MPWFDRTGPQGFGLLTGRGLGPCGRGFGFNKNRGRGAGFNFPRNFMPEWFGGKTLIKTDEKQVLADYKKALTEALEEVEAEEKELADK